MITIVIVKVAYVLYIVAVVVFFFSMCTEVFLHIILYYRVVLQFVHEMQQKAQANFDASRDKSLRVFGVGVVFVDDSAIFETRENLSNAATEVESILSSVVPPKKELLVLSIEGVFSGNSEEKRAMLNDLLNIIDDTTGKEDFLEHLRMLSLQKVLFKYVFSGSRTKQFFFYFSFIVVVIIIFT